MYLRDTKVMNEQHLKALEDSSSAVMAILQANLESLQLPDDVVEDLNMGEYEDIIK